MTFAHGCACFFLAPFPDPEPVCGDSPWGTVGRRLATPSPAGSVRIVANLHIQSVRSPFDDPRVASAAMAASSRADAMGLLSRQVACLDDGATRELRTGTTEAGIGRALLSELHRPSCSDPAWMAVLLERIDEALDESPAPAHEWRVLQGVPGPTCWRGFRASPGPARDGIFQAAGPRPTRLQAVFTFWPSSSAILRARTTASASGAG